MKYLITLKSPVLITGVISLVTSRWPHLMWNVVYECRTDRVETASLTGKTFWWLVLEGLSHCLPPAWPAQIWLLCFMFSLHQDVESYIHRSGRTGRAGRTGVCICFYQHKEEYQLAQVEQKAVRRFSWPSATALASEDHSWVFVVGC